MIFFNGVFDVLHAGHIKFLVEVGLKSKEMSLPVVAALDSDSKVRQDKGGLRPYFKFDERKNNLMKLVNFCEISEIKEFNSNENLVSLIKSLKPKLMMKGLSWKDRIVLGREFCEHIIFVDDYKFSYSTSEIEKRIRGVYLAELRIKFPGADLW